MTISSQISSGKESIRWSPLLVSVLILSLFIPSEFSFSIGSLRLTPYRIVLLFAFVPSLKKLLSGKVGSITFVDKFMFLHLFWSFIVIAYHHGGGVAIESGGIRMIEFGGAYLVARTNITSENEYRGVVKLILTSLVVIMPLVVIETLTGFHIIKDISSLITGGYFHSDMGARYGLYRAYASFDHPILWGLFSASALGFAWMRVPVGTGRRKVKYRKFTIISVITTALSSLSSGAIATLMTQITLFIWDVKTKNIKSRWKKFALILLFIYLIVDLLSNRSGMKVFLNYLTFSSHTAYYRVLIFDWGIQNVWDSPIFGIGFNDWIRAEWMASSSIDNFWLVQAMTFGIPGFITLAIAVVNQLSRNWKNMPPRYLRLRTGWTISMVGIIIGSCTVHMWNNLFVYFGFLLGMGAWFSNKKLWASSNKVKKSQEDGSF